MPKSARCALITNGSKPQRTHTLHMNRDEGTPVDEANMVGSELTLCPRRERNALNIQELESDITASGKVTAEDRELFAILKRADTSKNGMVSAHQAFAIFRDDAKVRPLLSLLTYPRPLSLTLYRPPSSSP